MGALKKLKHPVALDKTSFLETEGVNSPLLIRGHNIQRAIYTAMQKHILESAIAEEEKKYLLEVLEEVYNERRISSYLDTKVAVINQVVFNMLNPSEERESGSLFYCTSIRHHVKNHEW